MMRARLFQLPMRKAKTPTNSVFLTSRAMMSSSAPHAQNSAGQRDVDRDQRGGEKRDLAAAAARSRISMYWVNDPKETIDDACAAHGSLAFRRRDRRPPCGTRLLSFRGPGAGKPLFGACADVTLEMELALPEELAALLGPGLPARLQSVLLLVALRCGIAPVRPPADRHRRRRRCRRASALRRHGAGWRRPRRPDTITRRLRPVDSRSILLRALISETSVTAVG